MHERDRGLAGSDQRIGCLRPDRGTGIVQGPEQRCIGFARAEPAQNREGRLPHTLDWVSEQNLYRLLQRRPEIVGQVALHEGLNCQHRFEPGLVGGVAQEGHEPPNR